MTIIEKIEALPDGYDSDLCHAWKVHNDHQCQSDGFKLSDLKALVADLKEARKVIEHYGDESNWTRTAIHEGEMSSREAQAYLKERENPVNA